MTARKVKSPENPRAAAQLTLGSIAKVRPGEGLTFFVLSQAIVGTWTHWVNMRSLPCTSPVQGECVVDHRTAGARRWQGWLAVQRVVRAEPAFFSVTAGALKACPGLLRERTLRGCTMYAWRSGKDANSLLQVKLTDGAQPQANLLVAPDTVAFLRRLWDFPGDIDLPPAVFGFPPQAALLAFMNPPECAVDGLKGTIWEGMTGVEDAAPDGRQSKRQMFERLRKAGEQ